MPPLALRERVCVCQARFNTVTTVALLSSVIAAAHHALKCMRPVTRDRNLVGQVPVCTNACVQVIVDHNFVRVVCARACVHALARVLPSLTRS